MTKAEFLDTLRRRLAGLPHAEIDELLGDYARHFDDGVAAGRSETEIAQALGDPMRLARELRAEAGLRRWEEARTPANFFAAIAAFPVTTNRSICGTKELRFFADRAAKKWPLRGSLKLG